MLRQPPRSTRTYTPFPFTTLCRSRIGYGLGVRRDLGLLLRRAAARAIAAKHVHRLRRKPDMADDGDAARHQEADRLGHRLAAFHLDRGGPGFRHYARGAAKRLFRRGLIDAARHVDRHARMIGATEPRPAVATKHATRPRPG